MYILSLFSANHMITIFCQVVLWPVQACQKQKKHYAHLQLVCHVILPTRGTPVNPSVAGTLSCDSYYAADLVAGVLPVLSQITAEDHN